MQNPLPLHVIFGAGQVGGLLAQQLLAAGQRVRVVRRSPQKANHPHLEVRAADAYDRAQALSAAEGAAVVYQCTNAPYHEWPKLLKPLVTHIADAAQAADARLVVLDNLYMIGQLPQGPFGEDQPEQPTSQKGKIRKQIADDLRDRCRRGDLKLVFGRASDFWGPGVDQGALQHPRLMEQLVRGKTVELLADPGQLHSFSYTPDVARGLMLLGTQGDAVGQVWHLPVLPARTSLAHLQALAGELGQPLRTRQLPRWLLKAAGLFSPMLGELGEMMYQFDGPMRVDSQRFAAAFGAEPTPWEEQVRATAAWMRGRYAAPGAPGPNRP